MAAVANVRDQEEPYASLAHVRRQFEDYLAGKVSETNEQREARLYFHGAQWTKTQLEELKKRRQPPTTTPAFARKINGFVGLVEKLRQDPKAYPRTPKEDQGADLCTAALRYVLDQQEWQAKSPMVTMHGAVDAIGGIELSLTPGDSGQEGDYDIELDYVEPETFYYDPRSFRHDFSDARFMGVSKWVDLDLAKEMFPDKAEEIDGLNGMGSEFTIFSDREIKWYNNALKQLRLVEHWYRRGDKWLWCFFCGSVLLGEGRSYLSDEKGRDQCRYVMWSSFVDQDGDRYSFHRYMKSLVDEINQRNSKALHLLSMRRVKLEIGAVEDIEALRREAIRPDGVIQYTPGMALEFEDAKTLADMRGQLEMKESARSELENFGPNPALVGQGVESKSGRAIALLQQAGLAELGPFIIAYRGWKIRVYRAVWNAIRRHWTAQRWIRVTDVDGEQQAVQINGQQVDPMTGAMQAINAIGQLDVDIIIDEGPDAVNMQADALEVLQSAQSQGQQIPPQIMIELLPLPDSTKKKLLGMLAQAQQVPPEKQQAVQIELAQGAANVDKTKADTALSMAKAHKEQMPEPGSPITIEPGKSPLELAETAANAEHLRARSALAYAQADKLRMDTALAPQELAVRAANDRRRADAMTDRSAAKLS